MVAELQLPRFSMTHLGDGGMEGWSSRPGTPHGRPMGAFQCRCHRHLNEGVLILLLQCIFHHQFSFCVTRFNRKANPKRRLTLICLYVMKTYMVLYGMLDAILSWITKKKTLSSWVLTHPSSIDWRASSLRFNDFKTVKKHLQHKTAVAKRIHIYVCQCISYVN